MARIKESKQPKPITISRFFGLNCDNELDLIPGESPDMENFRITNDFRLKEREGCRKITDYWNEGTFPVLTGSYTYVSTLKTFHNRLARKYASGYVDNEDFYFYQINVYQKISDNSYEIKVMRWEPVTDGLSLKQYNTIVLGLVAEPTYVNSFVRNGYLYLMGAFGYYKYNGETESSVTGTIPTVKIGCTGSLSDYTIFQPLNMLTLSRRVRFVGGTGMAVDENLFRLPDVTATDTYTVDSVYVNNVLQVLDTDYIISEMTVSVYVAFIEGHIPADNADIAVVYTVGTATTNRDTILANRYNMSYGGQTDVDLFVWGGTEKNKIWNTYAGDVEHFSALGYRTAGEYDITNVVAQNTRQIIFTTNEVYSAPTDINPTTDYVDGVNIVLISYPITLVGTRGTPYYDTVQLIKNNPFFISNSMVFEMLVSTYRDDRSFKYMSQRAQPLMATVTKTIDWQIKEEYWIYFTTSALVYNYGNKTWYYFTGLPSITDAFIIDDELYLFNGTDIYKFDDSYISDYDGTSYIPVTAYWYSPFMDYGAGYILKSVNRAYLTLASDTNDSYIKLIWWTNEDTVDDVTDNCKDFELAAGANPKQMLAKLSAKRFETIKFKLICDKLDYTAEVLNLTTTANFGGYVRG